jgi:hypothetical protein
MVKYIRLKFKTVKSPEIIIYSKGRFKGFSISYKNSLNSLSKRELVSCNNKILETIEVLTISMDDYLFGFNEYDGFTYGVFLNMIDSMTKELENLDDAILSEIGIGIFHTKSYDSFQIKNSLSSFFNGEISVLTNMNEDRGVNNVYAFSKIHIKLNTYELKKQ